MLGKVASGQESHGFPPGYYVLTFSLFLWPFGALATEGGLAALNRFRSDPRLAFLLAWYLPYWIVCELLPTKLPHYMLPAYPALLLLVGWYLTERATLGVAPRWQVWLSHAARFGVIVVTAGLAALAIGLPIYLGHFPLWAIPCALAFIAAGWLGSGIRVSLSPLGRGGRRDGRGSRRDRAARRPRAAAARRAVAWPPDRARLRGQSPVPGFGARLRRLRRTEPGVPDGDQHAAHRRRRRCQPSQDRAPARSPRSMPTRPPPSWPPSPGRARNRWRSPRSTASICRMAGGQPLRSTGCRLPQVELSCVRADFATWPRFPALLATVRMFTAVICRLRSAAMQLAVADT